MAAKTETAYCMITMGIIPIYECPIPPNLVRLEAQPKNSTTLCSSCIDRPMIPGVVFAKFWNARRESLTTTAR
jgi:hypothetical protein